MAVTRRGYIFGTFLSGILSVVLIIVAVATDSWIVSDATPIQEQFADSNLHYGLFTGQLVLRNFLTPSTNTLYMTCVPEENACALSCKIESEARRQEVIALAQGHAPNPTCGSITTVELVDPPRPPSVIGFGFYVSLLLLLFLQLLFAVFAVGLGIINSTKNPTEPIFGLEGCLWSNAIAVILGLAALMTFGVYWNTSGLKDHLAQSYIALQLYYPSPGIGYSYWVLIVAVLCNILNVGLIQLRKYLLEKDPPPPVIKVENHSDGTIFLY